MEMIPVASSNIAAVGYDPETSEMDVQFLNGSVYRYFNVPESYFHDMLGASSKGSYHHHYIKKGGFDCQRIV
jgi:hypothetical protein